MCHGQNPFSHSTFPRKWSPNLLNNRFGGDFANSEHRPLAWADEGTLCLGREEKEEAAGTMQDYTAIQTAWECEMLARFSFL